MVNGHWLIADSGSTKTDWLFVASDGKRLELQTDGINPARDARDNIYNVLYHQLLTQLPQTSQVQKVCFYGAGCIMPFSQTVQDILCELFPGSSVEVESDLLGAARALCGHEAGLNNKTILVAQRNAYAAHYMTTLIIGYYEVCTGCWR